MNLHGMLNALWLIRIVFNGCRLTNGVVRANYGINRAYEQDIVHKNVLISFKCRGKYSEVMLTIIMCLIGQNMY